MLWQYKTKRIYNPYTGEVSNIQTRRRRGNVKKHDFKDGRGKVPALRWPHGGGWVDFTSNVRADVIVEKDAEVFGGSIIGSGCIIAGNSRIQGSTLQSCIMLKNCHIERCIAYNKTTSLSTVVVEGRTIRGNYIHIYSDNNYDLCGY